VGSGSGRRVAEREAADRASLGSRGVLVGGPGGVFEPEAPAGEGDDAGVVEEAVEDGGGGRDVADQLAPVLEGPIGSHEGGPVFVAAHDDLEQVLSGVLGQLLESHVVDDQEIGLEVVAQEPVFLIEGLVLQEVADEIEDGGISHEQVALDGLVADRLGEVGLAEAQAARGRGRRRGPR
jgi:hypothetical protein